MKRHRAFTMIELLIVIGLASIVFMVGIPNYNRFRQERSAASAAMQFVFDVRNVRQKCISLEQEAIFTLSSYFNSPPNQYSFPMPGENKTITRNLATQYASASMQAWGGTRFKITEGGLFSRDCADALVPNPDPGGQNYLGVSFSGQGGGFLAGTTYYAVKLFMNGETQLIQQAGTN